MPRKNTSHSKTNSNLLGHKRQRSPSAEVSLCHPLPIHGRVQGDGRNGGDQDTLRQTTRLVRQTLGELVDGRLGQAVADHAGRWRRVDGGRRSGQSQAAALAQVRGGQ